MNFYFAMFFAMAAAVAAGCDCKFLEVYFGIMAIVIAVDKPKTR